MAEKKIVQIDSVDTYNKLYGWETLHPLVTVVNHTAELPTSMNHTRLNYGLYALFLKQGEGCSIRYGREKYDYQEGTVVCFSAISSKKKRVSRHSVTSRTKSSTSRNSISWTKS